jgi:Flp pilus assembly protein TadB
MKSDKSGRSEKSRSPEEESTMKDAGLNKLLIALIGIPALPVCAIAWVRPMEISERILTTTVGVIGCTWALFLAISMRLAHKKEAFK